MSERIDAADREAPTEDGTLVLTRNLSSRLLIPNRLYGRREASEQLRASLERVQSGASELTSVSGSSGTGKSSLVDEFQRLALPPSTLFARGKFDAYKRDIPYSTIAEA